jgi:hypothetical protein
VNLKKPFLISWHHIKQIFPNRISIALIIIVFILGIASGVSLYHIFRQYPFYFNRDKE